MLIISFIQVLIYDYRILLLVHDVQNIVHSHVSTFNMYILMNRETENSESTIEFYRLFPGIVN